MKVVSFKYLQRKRKQKRAKIYCVGTVFKPMMLVMSLILVLLVANLIVTSFFSNIKASLQGYIESFVKFCSFAI